MKGGHGAVDGNERSSAAYAGAAVHHDWACRVLGIAASVSVCVCVCVCVNRANKGRERKRERERERERER
jgi:hypothetical protein